MTLSWKRVGERKIHVYLHRPGYTRLLYIFQAPPGISDDRITAEIAVRDPITGARLASR